MNKNDDTEIGEEMEFLFGEQFGEASTIILVILFFLVLLAVAGFALLIAML